MCVQFNYFLILCKICEEYVMQSSVVFAKKKKKIHATSKDVAVSFEFSRNVAYST